MLPFQNTVERDVRLQFQKIPGLLDPTPLMQSDLYLNLWQLGLGHVKETHQKLSRAPDKKQ